MKNSVIKFSFLVLLLSAFLASCSNTDDSLIGSYTSTKQSTQSQNANMNSTESFSNQSASSKYCLSTYNFEQNSSVLGDNIEKDYLQSVVVFRNDDEHQICLNSEEEKIIKEITLSYPLIKKMFDCKKEYTIIIEGSEYYYDSKTGMLGNNGVKILVNSEREKINSILTK